MYRILTLLLALAFGLCTLANSIEREEASEPKIDLYSPEQIQLLGNAIFHRDRAARLANDALFSSVPQAELQAMKGWVTTEVEDGWLVKFVAIQPELCALFEVQVSDSAGPVKSNKECLPLNQAEAAMFRAQQTALRVLDEQCSQNYNTVVFAGGIVKHKGWLVYLLAVPSTNGEVVVGGHKRVLVSMSGTWIWSYQPLSSSCLTLQKPEDNPESSSPAYLVASHDVSDSPVETHVFMSQQHDIPLFVRTEAGVWRVSSESVDFVGKLENFEVNPDGA